MVSPGPDTRPGKEPFAAALPSDENVPRHRLTFLLGPLAMLLAAACALGASGLLRLTGPGGTDWGDRVFTFTLIFFFLLAAASALYPRARFRVILAASLLQVLVLLGPVKFLGALGIYTAFYFLVRLEASWWLKAPALGGLIVSPCAVMMIRPGSRLIGVALAALFTGNFILRSLLYAYEATMKSDHLKRAGYAGFLLYLLAAPLSAVWTPPIGFLVLHKGLRPDLDPSLFRKGTGQMALGFIYLLARGIGSQGGLFPTQPMLVAAMDELNALTVIAACHLELLSLFLNVAGQVHVAVGMMRVLGFDIPPGMDRPYQSRNFLDFWKRWNTYYRDFLLTLAYYPVVMALKKRPFLAITLAGSCTFLLSGFTHALINSMRDPATWSWRGFLAMHKVFLAQGFLVILWMHMALSKRRSPLAATAAGETPRGTWDKVSMAVSVALTLTVTGLNLLLFSPRFGFPDPAAFGTLRAIFRPPWR